MSAQPVQRPAARATATATDTASSISHKHTSQPRPESPKIASKTSGFDEMRPELAIVVTLDPSNTEKNVANIKSLTKVLLSNGLYVQVRQGVPGTALVFVKCCRTRLAQQRRRTRVADWLHDVKNEHPDDEDAIAELTPAETLRLVHEAITAPTFEGGCGVKPSHPDWPFVSAIFCLHDAAWNKAWLRRLWRPVMSESDLNSVRVHLGDEVGLYFAFVDFYIRWAVAPAVAGVITAATVGAYSWIFAVFNLVWGTAFVAAWKRRQRQLAISWGSLGSSAVSVRRPEFRGETQEPDPSTGEPKPSYSAYKRTLRQFGFVPVGLAAAVLLVLFQLTVFVVEIFLTQVYTGPLKAILGVAPAVLLALGSAVLSTLYAHVVTSWTAWENHEFEGAHTESLNQKHFVFHFLTAYMGLFISAFVYLPFAHLITPYLPVIQSHVNLYGRFAGISTHDSFEVNAQRLHGQVVFVITTANIINFVSETVVPYALRTILATAKRFSGNQELYDDSADEVAYLAAARAQSQYADYNVHEDYRQLVTQFGYTVIFAPVYPLAPLWALINNIVQFRGDALKIVFDTRRPLPARAESVGGWVPYMNFLTWVGSLVCASIMAMFSPGSGSSIHGGIVGVSAQVILVAVLVSEHLFLLVRLAIDKLYQVLATVDTTQYRQHKYQLRRRYLNAEAKQPALAPTPAENEWASVTQEQLADQVVAAVTKVKTLQDKKKE